MRKPLSRLATALLAACSVPAWAGPPATLDEIAWLTGSWAGTGIAGAPAGETYSAPAGGQMAGHFWQLAPGGEVQFYELITIVPDGDSLTMRLKHFGPDLGGWEGQPGSEAVEFPLTARDGDRWEFSGLIYQRIAPDALRIEVPISRSDGSNDTLVFDFRSVP